MPFKPLFAIMAVCLFCQSAFAITITGSVTDQDNKAVWKKLNFQIGSPSQTNPKQIVWGPRVSFDKEQTANALKRNKFTITLDGPEQFLRVFTPNHQVAISPSLTADFTWNPKLKLAESIGVPAPDFRFTLLDPNNPSQTTPASLSDYRGKFILLNFWSSSKKSDAEQYQTLTRVHHDFAQDNLVVLNISLYRDPAKAADIIKNFDLPFVNGHAGPMKTSNVPTLYHFKSTPQAMLIDPKGRIVSHLLRGNRLYNNVKYNIHPLPKFKGKAKIGSPAPNFTLDVINYKAHNYPEQIQLSDFRGSYVLIDIFASWCGHCHRVNDTLKSLQRMYAGTDKLVIIGLSVNKDKDDDVKFINSSVPYMAGHAGNWGKGKIAKHWQHKTIPAVFLIDPDGVLIDQGLYRRTKDTVLKTVGKP